MKVFVYGTLQKGCRLHHALTSSEFVCKAKTKPIFDLIDVGWFPAALNGGQTIIKGEGYEVDRDVLNELDRIEGVPTLYRRPKTTLSNGVRAWIYTMVQNRNAEGPQIKSGDWKKYMSKRGSK